MEDKSTNHKGYDIQLQGRSFRLSPTVPGLILSIWVVNSEKNVNSRFTFIHSLLDSFENMDTKEREIIDRAVELIKEYIDSEKIKNLDDFEFEYKNHQFIERSRGTLANSFADN